MDSKACTKCGEVKPLDAFPVNRKMRSGRDSICRACYAAKQRKYYRENTEKCIATARAYYLNNKEKCDARVKRWSAENPERRSTHRKKWRDENYERARAIEKACEANNREKRLAAKREYFKKNRHRWVHYAGKRRAALLNATPWWSDLEAIEQIYRECAETTAATGVEHHVDHIVPLIHPLVSGLHVPWNLRVIPGKENREKSNKL